MSSLLLRLDPETLEPMLRSGSDVRLLVEAARVSLIKHIRKRWLDIREKSGFIGLEAWALKEIGDGEWI